MDDIAWQSTDFIRHPLEITNSPLIRPGIRDSIIIIMLQSENRACSVVKVGEYIQIRSIHGGKRVVEGWLIDAIEGAMLRLEFAVDRLIEKDELSWIGSGRVHGVILARQKDQ
jgi:hypothetical protein